MDMEREADALLARIKMVRDDLDAGRLTTLQVQLYRLLGREVEQITHAIDDAPDTQAAEALWVQGVDLIRIFLDEHFSAPTFH